MIKVSESETEEVAKNKEQKINEIYEKLTKENQDFAVLAKQFSNDQGSARRGGELPMFSTGKMVEEFENAAFGLKNDNDISKPVRTQYGWHLIKRLSVQPLGSYDDLYNDIKAKVSRDGRSNRSKEVLLKRIKLENRFKELINERNDFYSVVTKDELIKGTWSIEKAKRLNKLMFGFYAKDGDKAEYTQTDFAKYLTRQKPQNPNTISKSFNVKTEIN